MLNALSQCGWVHRCANVTAHSVAGYTDQVFPVGDIIPV